MEDRRDSPAKLYVSARFTRRPLPRSASSSRLSRVASSKSSAATALSFAETISWMRRSVSGSTSARIRSGCRLESTISAVRGSVAPSGTPFAPEKVEDRREFRAKL